MHRHQNQIREFGLRARGVGCPDSQGRSERRPALQKLAVEPQTAGHHQELLDEDLQFGGSAHLLRQGIGRTQEEIEWEPASDQGSLRFSDQDQLVLKAAINKDSGSAEPPERAPGEGGQPEIRDQVEGKYN